MSIEMPAENLAIISFYGKDKEIGQALLNYYSRRFIQKAKEGLARSMHKESNVNLPALVGNLEIKAHRSLWRSERLVPLMLIGFISLNVILVILVVFEWSDPSFKSERQVAQYLELPILGSLPDLNKISAALASKREG
jgi:capsular polysaccharide biosynthesis protein